MAFNVDLPTERDEALRVGSIGLTILGIAALLLGLAGAELRLDDLGLAAGLPVAFWFGVVALPAASAVEWLRGDRASSRMIALQLAAWFVVMWLMPLVLEGTPRFRTSYVNYGYVDPIVRGEGLDGVRFLYHNWPLFSLLMAVLVLVGVPILVLLAAVPVIAVAVYMLVVPFFLQAVGRLSGHSRGWGEGSPHGKPWLATRHWLMVLWLLPVFDWTGQDYFSPQALAYAFFLGFVAVLAFGAAEAKRRLTPRQTAIALILFTLLVMTHVLTSVFALAILAAVVVTRQVRGWGILLTALAIFFAWQVYIAAPFYVTYGDRLLEGLLRLGAFFESNVADRVQGSPGHSVIVRLRIVATAIMFGLGALSAILMVRQNHRDRGLLFCATALGGVGIITPLSIYGGEALIRSLLFSLPMLLGLVLLTVDRVAVRVAISLALIVGAPLHVFTHYGNELYDFVTPHEVDGFYRTAELAPANVYGGFPGALFLNTTLLDARNPTLPRTDDPTTVEDYLNPEDHAWARAEWPVYVVINRGDYGALRLFRNDTGLLPAARAALEADPRFELVYRNEDVEIFRANERLAQTRP